MKRRTFVRPEAQTDIREAARWYQDREVGLGLRFIREIRTSLEHISHSPLRFPIEAILLRLEIEKQRLEIEKLRLELERMRLEAPTQTPSLLVVPG